MGAAVGERLTASLSPRQAGDPVPSRPRNEWADAIRPGNLRSKTASPRPKTELRRVTIHEHDPRNDCMTVRGVGFSWRCDCGRRGPIFGSRDAALAGRREHEAGHR